jgi:hypothetical protein
LKPFLAEAEQLYNVSKRLEELAEQHTPVSETLMMILGSVRNTAADQEVLVVTGTTQPN